MRRAAGILRLLLADKFACAGVIVLLLLVVAALLGSALVGDLASKINMKLRNLPPFSLEHGLTFVLGADALGRSLLARILVGARNTLAIAFTAVFIAALVGASAGVVAGYFGRGIDQVIMRIADVIISFPSLLLALVVLYLLGPSVGNLILVIAIARSPLYLRTARAEVLELRTRNFVKASQAMGASTAHILLKHIVPLLAATLLTVAAVDFAAVILVESALSFLGFGIQPPDFTWGSMVAAGRGYLASAWWLAFWPGLMILITTLSFNFVANWARILMNPNQRWRLEGG